MISQFVIDEASAGQPILSAERLAALTGVPLLPLDSEIAEIADEIMARASLPPKARTDALHIAAVAHHRVLYLLTWNCRHIANGRILSRIRTVLSDMGIPIPTICAPEEMVSYDPGALHVGAPSRPPGCTAPADRRSLLLSPVDPLPRRPPRLWLRGFVGIGENSKKQKTRRRGIRQGFQRIRSVRLRDLRVA